MSSPAFKKSGVLPLPNILLPKLKSIPDSGSVVFPLLKNPPIPPLIAAALSSIPLPPRTLEPIPLGIPNAVPTLLKPAPKAPPTPGTSNAPATGATFLTTFLIFLNTLERKPNSGKPVSGFKSISPLPTIYLFGSTPYLLIEFKT